MPAAALPPFALASWEQPVFYGKHGPYYNSLGRRGQAPISSSAILTIAGTNQVQVNAQQAGAVGNTLTVTLTNPGAQSFPLTAYVGGTPASLVLTGNNVEAIANTPGSAGNNITFAIVNQGGTAPFSITTTTTGGITNIVYRPATSVGAITDTQATMIANVNADPTANKLITLYATGAVTGVCVALPATALAGGVNDPNLTNVFLGTNAAGTIISTEANLQSGLANSYNPVTAPGNTPLVNFTALGVPATVLIPVANTPLTGGVSGIGQEQATYSGWVLDRIVQAVTKAPGSDGQSRPHPRNKYLEIILTNQTRAAVTTQQGNIMNIVLNPGVAHQEVQVSNRITKDSYSLPSKQGWHP